MYGSVPSQGIIFVVQLTEYNHCHPVCNPHNCEQIGDITGYNLLLSSCMIKWIYQNVFLG